jgi:hypothetical protein
MTARIDSQSVIQPVDKERVFRSIQTDLAANLVTSDALVELSNEIKADYNALQAILTTDNIITATALSTGSTPENIASTAFSYRIDGAPANKAAVAAGTAFSAADTINTGAAGGVFWGVWLVQIDIAGTISTKPGGGLSDQVYASEVLAIAALPAATAANAAIGYVTIAATAGADWVAITDDITDGSDNTSVDFYNTAATVPTSVSSSDATSSGTLGTTQS